VVSIIEDIKQEWIAGRININVQVDYDGTGTF
jgi:hypothetical protein